MIVLLDSTVLIDVLKGLRDRRTLLDRLVEENHRLATSAVNVGEVYGGMRLGEETRTQSLFAMIECYPVTEAIARRAGGMQSQWARKGRTLELADMMVAATALEYGIALMTDNRRDFPMDELAFYPFIVTS